MTWPCHCRDAMGCLALSVVALTGCRHTVPVAFVPALPVPTISVPPPTHRFEAFPEIELEATVPLTVEVARLPLPRFRPRPTTSKQLALLLQPAPPPAIVLGELTTGGEADNDSLRQATQSLLQTQQQRLRSVPSIAGRANSREVDQAKLFMRQAFDAWHKRDVEGAHVLATKARVLLDDIEK